MPVKSSTVDTTKTTTSTASKVAPKRRAVRILAEPSVIQQASAHWSNMTGDQKNSYAAAAADMANALAPGIQPHATPYKTFVALSAANMAAGQPLQSTAMPYASAPALPALQLIATYINNRLTLTLVPAAPYAHPIGLKAAIPLLAGVNVYKSTSFKKIGALPSLSGPIDITDLYLARYRVPGTGYKIAIEVMGVAPGGYHTQGVQVIGVVSPIAAEALLSDPDTQSAEPLTLKVG